MRKPVYPAECSVPQSFLLPFYHLMERPIFLSEAPWYFTKNTSSLIFTVGK